MRSKDVSKLFGTYFRRKLLSIGQYSAPSIVGDPFAIFFNNLENILQGIGGAVHAEPRIQRRPRFKVEPSSGPTVRGTAPGIMGFQDDSRLATIRQQGTAGQTRQATSYHHHVHL